MEARWDHRGIGSADVEDEVERRESKREFCAACRYSLPLPHSRLQPQNGESVSGRPRFQILFLARPYLSAFFFVRCLSYRFAIFSVPIFSVSDVKKLVVRHGRRMWRYADGTLAFWLRDTYVRLLEWLELPPSLLQSDSC